MKAKQENMFDMSEENIEREKRNSKLFADGISKLIEAGVKVTMAYPDGVEINVQSIVYEAREKPSCPGKFLQIIPFPVEIVAGHPPLVVDMAGLQASLALFNDGISFRF